MRFRAFAVMSLAVVAACGSGVETADPTFAPSTLDEPAAEPETPGPTAITESAPMSTITQPATATSHADRLEQPVRIAWIGGSEVDHEGVSVARSAAGSLTEVNGNPASISIDTQIAPYAEDIAAKVEAAADRDVDALVVSLNISWLTWERPACDEIEVAAVRYVCVLSPISPEATARRDAAMHHLIDTIVATGLPAYLYTLPHSSTSMTDPNLADLIAGAEQQMAGYDPDIDRIAYRAESFTRHMTGVAEPEQFIDMVHPTPAGADVLADWLVTDLEAFFERVELGAS